MTAHVLSIVFVAIGVGLIGAALLMLGVFDRIRWRISDRWRGLLEELDERRGVPHPLSKALCDPFDYALGLRDGTVIRFHYADAFKGGWVRINVGQIYDGGFVNDKEHRTVGDWSFDRGLYVRVSDIVWIADAPQGS
jgi:hypothetical protein